ncbi:MAG: acetyl-CoA carboxylase carboxyl transferase subunit alpha, partial [Chlorobaculum sp.]|nr:acetyl-CoA carboxylase carboxyl transferase subunit alpha [Chlorobaculum sp.]
MAGKVVLDFEKPLYELEEKLSEMRVYLKSGEVDSMSEGRQGLKREIEALEAKVESLRKTIYKNLTRWQKVQLARHPERPYTLDYIYMMMKDFVELSG